jgi:N-acetylglucosamine transport system substrate-binding protein
MKNGGNKMIRKSLALIMALILCFSLAACETNKEKSQEDTKVDATEKADTQEDSKNDEEEPKAEELATEPVTLKVAFFQGGYGDEWIKQITAAFMDEYPNVTVELQGDPGIMEKMEPMLQSGANLPDVAFLLNTKWQMWATQGYLADLSDLYNNPAFDKDVPFKDTMNEAAKSYSLVQDKAYIIPWSDGVLGMAYNAGMFEEHGWEVPKTASELDALAAKMSEKGIAPFVYPGKVAAYWSFMVNPLMVQAGGLEFLQETLAMESPEVFNHPARLKAYQEFESWFKKGYMLEGSEALSHTEAQMEFLAGKAAMIPNGSWLENEMKSALPEGFRMKMMAVPALKDAILPNVTYSMVGDIILVPEKSENKDWAKEFIRFASSQEMNKIFTKETGGFRPFDYSLEGVDVTEFTASALDIMNNNVGFTLNTTSPMYLRMTLNPSGDPMGGITFGNITAEEQVKADYAEALDKWDEYVDELGLND